MPEHVPILLSAASREDLLLEVRRVSQLIESLTERGPGSDAAMLSDIAAGASVRTPQRLRLAISVDSLENLSTTLSDLARRQLSGQWSLQGDSAQMSESRAGRQKIVFLYPGQGSQRYGENSDLARASREYRRRVESLQERFSPIDVGRFLSTGWTDTGQSRPGDGEIASTDISQAMLTVLGVSTTDALAALGVKPDFALGHSVGEFGAAYASGLIDEEEACTFVGARIRCVRDSMPPGEFGMLAIGLGREQTESLIRIPEDVTLSSDNSTRQVVYAGPMAAIRGLAAEAERADVKAALLKTQGAFHTSYFHAADKAFQGYLAEHPRKNRQSTGATLVSSVSGRLVADAEQCWDILGHQISLPVLFRTALATLGDHEPTVLVQLYGGRSLISMYKAVNPGFSGVEVAFGGADPGHSRRLSENLCKLFLAVEDFDASTILGRQGIAALGHQQATEIESIQLNSTKNRDVDMPGKLETNDVDQQRPPQVRTHRSADLQVVSAFGAEASTYQRELLTLLTSQVALLQDCQSATPQPFVQQDGRQPPAAQQGTSIRASVRTAPVLVAASPVVAPKNHALGEITAFVVQTIAAQAGYSHSEVGLGDTLGEGLGLDSLIVADLAQRLHRNYEMWLPREVDFESIRTVGDLAHSVASAYEAPAAVSVPLVPVVQDELQHAQLPAPTAQTVPGEALIDSFPEVLAMQDRVEKMARSDARNPYYLEVEGAIGSHCSIGGKQLISFSSYNYLGLSTHPQVVGAAWKAIETYGTSVSAARILSGNRPLHTELESRLSALLKVEDAVVMVGGHSTNMGIIPHLLDERDIVFHDSLVHDSILQGIKASGAARHSFAHNQADELERALSKRRGQFRRALIIAEGIYSMDGDLPPLAKLVELKERFGATLMVDEAHSIGVLGRHGGGICEELGVDSSKIDILMGTLSKSFASCGGYLAGSRLFIQSLRYSLSGYIFSAGMTPANTAAALESIRVMAEEPDRLVRLRQNSKYFLARATEMGFNCGTAVGVPVVPTIFADSQLTLGVANLMFENGVSVNPIIFPAVAESLARLRFFITSEHTPELIDQTLSALKVAVRSAEEIKV